MWKSFLWVLLWDWIQIRRFFSGTMYMCISIYLGALPIFHKWLKFLHASTRLNCKKTVFPFIILLWLLINLHGLINILSKKKLPKLIILYEFLTIETDFPCSTFLDFKTQIFNEALLTFCIQFAQVKLSEETFISKQNLCGWMLSCLIHMLCSYFKKWIEAFKS